MEHAIEAEIRAIGRIASDYSAGLRSTPIWKDRRSLKVLGIGNALPGPPVPTAALLERIEKRFDVEVVRRGTALASRLGIDTRNICRDFDQRHEAPRPANSNPDLAAAALRAALDDAGLDSMPG